VVLDALFCKLGRGCSAVRWLLAAAAAARRAAAAAAAAASSARCLCACCACAQAATGSCRAVRAAAARSCCSAAAAAYLLSAAVAQVCDTPRHMSDGLPEELSWRYLWGPAGLHPAAIGGIWLRCWSSADVVALQVLGTLPPVALVVLSRGDWVWLDHWRPLPPVGLVLGGGALGLGMMVPALLPLLLWLRARRDADRALGVVAVQIARAVLLGLLYVTAIKTLTGREHPPPMNQGLGWPCVRTSVLGDEGPCERAAAGSALNDSSTQWWWAAADPATVVTGWPSGHTMSATALAVSGVGSLHPQGGVPPPTRSRVVAAAIAWVLGMAFIMACSGALCHGSLSPPPPPALPAQIVCPSARAWAGRS
jgi:hypothetical protein